MPVTNPAVPSLPTLPAPSTYHLSTPNQPTPASTPRTHHLSAPVIATPHKRREVIAAATPTQRRSKRCQPDDVAEERKGGRVGQEGLREEEGVDAAGCGTEGAGQSGVGGL